MTTPVNVQWIQERVKDLEVEVEGLRRRLQRSYELLLITRQSPMFHHPGRPTGWRTLIKQVLEIMEGER